MNRDRLQVCGILLLLPILFFLNVAAAHAQSKPAMSPGKEEKLIGHYEGFVRHDPAHPDKDKRATLDITNPNDPDCECSNFELRIEGEPPIHGRIVARSYHNSRTIFVNLRSDQFETSSLEAPTSLSLHLLKRPYGITLKSVEADEPFIFQPCLPPPGCKDQPACVPCGDSAP